MSAHRMKIGLLATGFLGFLLTALAVTGLPRPAGASYGSTRANPSTVNAQCLNDARNQRNSALDQARVRYDEAYRSFQFAKQEYERQTREIDNRYNQQNAMCRTRIPQTTGSPVCGNQLCEYNESSTCPRDCAPVPTCGNFICETNEYATCSSDCRATESVCGNRLCEPGEPGVCRYDCVDTDPVLNCSPYVCRDGETAPRCHNGYPISYFVAPCAGHGGEV